MNKKVLIVWFLCSLLLGAMTFAQDSDSSGTATELDIIWIVPPGEEPIDIEKADRVYYKAKVKPEEKETKPQTYSINEFDINLADLNPKMRIPKMPKGKIPLLYGNYFKLGFGNYVTPMFDLYLGSKRNEKFSYGLNLNHLSSLNGPIDKSNSGYSSNGASVFGNMFTDKLTIGSRLNYNRNAFKFYGYHSDSSEFFSDESRILNQISYDLSIANRELTDGIRTNNQFRFEYNSDNLDVSDLLLGINSNNSFNINDDVEAYVNLSGDFENYSIADSSSARYLAGLNGGVKLSVSDIDLKVGLNLQYSGDTVSGKNFHIYPDVKASYAVNDGNVNIFGQLGGGTNWNTWSQLIERNPILNRSIAVINENEFINLEGGVNGIIKDKFNYSVSLGYRRLDNLATFQNDSIDQSKFNVLYDLQGASNIYTKLNLGYKLTDDVRASASIRLNQWNTEQLTSAWHLPNTEASMNLRYKIIDNIYINTDFYYISGIQAFDFSLDKEITLDKITDLSLGIDYLVGSKFSCFMNFNNLLSGNYQRYFRYPSQGINFLGGLTYTF